MIETEMSFSDSICWANFHMRLMKKNFSTEQAIRFEIDESDISCDSLSNVKKRLSLEAD